MASEYKTLGEVSVAVDGVKETISWHAKILVGVLTVAIAVMGYLAVQTTSLSSGVARIDERTIHIDKRLDSIERTLDELRTLARQANVSLEDIRTASASPTIHRAAPEENAFVGWTGTPVVETSSGIADALMNLPANVDRDGPVWLYAPLQQ